MDFGDVFTWTICVRIDPMLFFNAPRLLGMGLRSVTPVVRSVRVQKLTQQSRTWLLNQAAVVGAEGRDCHLQAYLSHSGQSMPLEETLGCYSDSGIKSWIYS